MYAAVREKTLKRLGGCHFKSFAPDKKFGRSDEYLEHKGRRTDLY
jgi:hypothetical protein